MSNLTTSIKEFTSLTRASGPTCIEATKCKAPQQAAPAPGGAGPGASWYHYFTIHRRLQKNRLTEKGRTC